MGRREFLERAPRFFRQAGQGEGGRLLPGGPFRRRSGTGRSRALQSVRIFLQEGFFRARLPRARGKSTVSLKAGFSGMIFRSGGLTSTMGASAREVLPWLRTIK